MDRRPIRNAPRTRGRLRCALATSALLFAACIPLPRGQTLSRKTVASKEVESTLVADDGARCSVSADTFASVQVGDEHSCIWKEREGKPEHTAAPPHVPDPLY